MRRHGKTYRGVMLPGSHSYNCDAHKLTPKCSVASGFVSLPER
jgi:hypothetical protein